MSDPAPAAPAADVATEVWAAADSSWFFEHYDAAGQVVNFVREASITLTAFTNGCRL